MFKEWLEKRELSEGWFGKGINFEAAKELAYKRAKGVALKSELRQLQDYENKNGKHPIWQKYLQSISKVPAQPKPKPVVDLPSTPSIGLPSASWVG